jgi:hypothetical protein
MAASFDAGFESIFRAGMKKGLGFSPKPFL